MFQEPTQEQKDEFHKFLGKLLSFISEETGFVPTVCRQKMMEDGAYDAVIALVYGKSAYCGFEEFYVMGRLKFSLEAVVVSERWSHLFPEEIYTLAHRRLKNYGYDFPSASSVK